MQAKKASYNSGLFMVMTSLSLSRDSLLRIRRLWPMLVVVLPCLLLALGGEPVRSALRYDRVAILSGQVWRIFTGNFVHLGWGHVGEDLAGYVLLWLLLEDVLPNWRCPALIAAGSVGVGLGLLAADPSLRWYVGISGALNTLWVVGAMRLMTRRDWLGWVLGIFLVLKIAYEQTLGPLPWSVATTGGPVVVDAHLWGAITGAVIGAADTTLQRFRWPVKRP